MKTHKKHITRGLITFTCLALFTIQSTVGQSVSLPQDPQKFHIYLLMGQSNMEGAQAIDEPMDEVPHPRVFKLNSWNSWEQAKDPITNNEDPAIGPGLSFAKKLADEREDITVGLVPLADGGTYITDWSKGSQLYQATLNAVAVARNYGVIKGILWHQGEHDGIYQWDAAAYPARLVQLEDDLRKDLRMVDLPFITGGFVDGINRSNHHYALGVLSHLKANARKTYLTGYVRTNKLPYLSDNLHFSTAGQRVLGERYCDEYLRITDYWTEKGKETLDAEAEELEGGWKYHPSLGLYYDANYPIVKHAQLGWIVLSYNPDTSITLRSRFFGKLRTYLNPPANGLYLYRENIDQELIDNPGDTYYMNLLATENTQSVFYNHTTSSWSRTIDATPVFDTINELNAAAEQVFGMTQASSTETIIAAQFNNWSEVRKKLLETEENRMLMILYTEDTYWFANRNLTGNAATFWKEHALNLLSRIDAYLIDAQVQYQNFVNRL